MIRFIVGVPGSGKTYYAAHRLYQIHNDEKISQRYDYIYTNVNQFDLSIDKRFCYYDHDSIFKRLQLLHKYYKKKVTDKKLIRLARLLKLHRAYFVIDEAHNYFDVRNTVLVWWLSYHRHLFQDIDLITQNLSLIDSKYKGFTEYFVRALPQSLRLFQKKFTYRLFIDSRMSQKSRAGTETLKYNPEVFALYHSGDKPKTKNIVFRYLLLALLFFIPAAAILWYVERSWSKSDPDYVPPKKPTVEKTVISSEAKPIDRIDADQTLEIVHCVRGDCVFRSIRFPFKILKPLIAETDSKLLYIDSSFATNRHAIYILATDRFTNLFKGVKHDEVDASSVVADLLDRQ